jgi:hypothetical protein
MATKQKPCRCPAYPFPHREFGGKCSGKPPKEYEDQWEEPWWPRPARFDRGGHFVLGKDGVVRED